MKISAKGRYGLAAMTHIAQNNQTGDPITIISIAEKLGISKIYLEQVFSLLKRAGLVLSIKGAQGGYQLAVPPQEITVFAVLSAIELALFEQTESTVKEKAPVIDEVMQITVFNTIDQTLEQTLKKITLTDLVNEVEKHKDKDNLMYFI
ncbi:RrF2 family transcriptional regulator [Anaerosinus massiliensis]|uniref:RrF2 family transcriptional regulator n=1 Tax=Massilibacillus massiliensis TaxID=1806837 RepID=UPI000DA61EF7|nr:Rrf2 family transcriptional regulator [Massilibacillus massiliensis]